MVILHQTKPNPRCIPELHACTPGADVLTQQQVVEAHSIDGVEELANNLLADLRVQAVVRHGGVKLCQLPFQGLQCVAHWTSAITVNTSGAVPVAHGLHPGQARDAFTFKHGRHYQNETRKAL